nr:galactosyltransferase-related protein [uncultured Actinoplanes sp.]
MSRVRRSLCTRSTAPRPATRPQRCHHRLPPWRTSHRRTPPGGRSPRTRLQAIEQAAIARAELADAARLRAETDRQTAQREATEAQQAADRATRLRYEALTARDTALDGEQAARAQARHDADAANARAADAEHKRGQTEGAAAEHRRALDAESERRAVAERELATLREQLTAARTTVTGRLEVTGDYATAHLWGVWDVRHRFEAIAAASGTWPTTDDVVAHLRLVESGHSAMPWLGLTSCHASLPARLCREVGMFDDGYRGWGEEDAELGYRLWRAGAEFRALPDVAVNHQAHPRTRQDTQSWFDNYLYATGKHPSTDWYLRWRLSLGYITPTQYEETMREVLAGDVRREKLIRRQFDTFVRLWPTMRYGALLKTLEPEAVRS